MTFPALGAGDIEFLLIVLLKYAALQIVYAE